MDKREELISVILDDMGVRWSDRFYIVDGNREIEFFNKRCKQMRIKDDEGDILTWDVYVEEIDYEWGYSDEYSLCDDCNSVIRTSPDSYHWKPDYKLLNDCELICGDCIRKNYAKSVISELLRNAEKGHFETANVLGDLYKYGFSKVDDRFQNGMFGGMKDTPEKVYNSLKDNYHVLFTSAPSQFYVDFYAWVLPKMVRISYVDPEEGITELVVEKQYQDEYNNATIIDLEWDEDE